MRNLFAAVIFWCVAFVLKATGAVVSSNVRFTHVTCEAGLSQNHVKAIVKDRDGFLWLGTKNGLNRFDGSSVVRKSCRDGAVEGHDISALCAAKDGTLWVGTERGLFRYNPRTDTFSFIDAKTEDGEAISRWVLNITEDAGGNVWIAVPAQGVFRWTGGKLSGYHVISREQAVHTPVSHLYVRHNGEVWLATWGGGLYRYDRVNDTFVVCPTDRNGYSLSGLKIVMMCDYANGIALGIHEGQLLLYEPQENRLRELECPGLSATMVRTLAEADGTLWIGTYDGVFVWRDGLVTHLDRQPADVRSLPDDVIYAMCPDKGGMWLGTLSAGACYTYFTNLDFTKYVPDGVTAPLRVRDMETDSAGNCWLATENAGLFRWNVAQGSMERKRLGEDIPLILSLTSGGNRLYCGTFMHGLYVLDLRTEAVRRLTFAEMGLGEEGIYALHADRNGNVWMGTDHGLYRADASDLSFHKVALPEEAWIFCIMESADGTLWLGTMGSGVWAYDMSRGTCRTYRHEDGNPNSLSGNSVNALMEDGKGRLWIATDGNGLCKLEGEQGVFTTCSVKDGFPDDVIYGLQEDTYGCLWMGTNRGLVCFNPDNGAVRVYTEEVGLPDNRFNYGSVTGGDGRLFLGTIDGVVAFTPERMMPADEAYPLFLTRLTVNNREYDVVRGEDGGLLSPVYAGRIVLRHDESNLCFGMAMLDYKGVSSDRYYYRMEPLDGDWVSASDPKNIVYAHLAPGTYELHVKAVSGWSGAETERTIHIEILPPWWRTWWAYTLYIITCIGIVMYVVKSYRRGQERRMRIRQRFFELEKQKELYEAKMQMWAEKEKQPETVEEPVLTVAEQVAEPEQGELLAVPVPHKEVSEVDKEWAERIKGIVDDNLMDESFNVEAMAEILCMSRSTLLRRFKQTFDCSPVELIRLLRLNKAAELINEGRYRISDVGYMVGFSSASYFSKNFQKQFGVSPKDYAKRCCDTKVKIDAANHFRMPETPIG